MAWSGKQRGWLGATLAGTVLLCAGGPAFGSSSDPEVDRWFVRHSDEVWRPLAEKWDAVKALMTSPVEKLQLPLEYYANGRIKAMLRAEKAQLFLDGLIFAQGVSVELLTETGQSDGRLTAEGCLFDRNAKHGYCEGAVSVEKSGDRLKGRGMYFSIEAQFIKILSDCEIRTRRMQNNFGRLK